VSAPGALEPGRADGCGSRLGRAERAPQSGEHRAHAHGHHDREDIGADNGEAEPGRVGKMGVWVHGAAKVGRTA
jgi:hypothetical protein